MSLKRGNHKLSLQIKGGLIGSVVLAAGCATTSVDPDSTDYFREARAVTLFNDIAHDPVALRIFLRRFPKGGDLHNHISGMPYAEEFLSWASDADFCIFRDTLKLDPPPCNAPGEVSARNLIRTDPKLFEEAVNAMSVREFLADVDIDQSGHNQFFESFGRFGPIVRAEPARVLASARKAGAEDFLLYQELMKTPHLISAFAMAGTEDWVDDFDLMYASFADELPSLIEATIEGLDASEANASTLLGCGTDLEDPACENVVYFNCHGLRLIPTYQLFRQLAGCFALIEADSRYLGVSLVQPEDDPIAIADYDLHMRMIAWFREKHPTAQISLHAGELTMGLAPAYAMRDHIEKAIHIAGSQRIGHGIDIAYELNSRDTLAHMADEQIAVEVNLSSNDVILGISGDEHPLNLYRASGVPIVLSTDDQGVLRTDMTEQYVRAVLEHGLTYKDLKEVSRNSLEFAFLPGFSLWVERGKYEDRVEACSSFESQACLEFKAASVKASLQVKLEEKFELFEADIIEWQLN